MPEFDEMSTDELWTALPETEGAEKGRLLMHLMSRNEANHEHVTAAALAQQAAEVFNQHGLDREYANAKAFEGDSHMKLEEYDEAKNCYLDAIAHLDEVLDVATIAAITMSLGENEDARHNNIEALGHYICAVDLWIKEENWDDAIKAQGKILKKMFTYARPSEQLIEADKFYDLAKKADNSHAIMQALCGKAIASDNNENYADAIKWAKDALVVARACTCDRCVPEVQEILGTVYLHAGNNDKAQELLKLSIKNFRKNGYSRPAIFAKAQLGHTYIETKPKKAKKIFTDILTLCEHVENNRAQFSAGEGLIRIYKNLRKNDKVMELYEQLIPSALKKNLQKVVALLSLDFIQLLCESGDVSKAQKFYKNINPIFLSKPERAEKFVKLRSTLGM